MATKPVDAFLVWNSAASGEDSIDQESFASVLASMGFPYSRLSPTRIEEVFTDRGTLVVIPHASAALLSKRLARFIVGAVKEGASLVTDGESALSSDLNVQLAGPVRVISLVDKLLPDIPIWWPDHPTVRWVARYARNSSSVLYADSAGGHPLGLGLRLAKGRCIYLAPLLDPKSGRGYARFPTLTNAVLSFLRCQPKFRRSAVDAYFDPGYRFNIPIATLAMLWREWGIRAVHAATWYNIGTRPYDYRGLIEAAHANGILVYAWLEWPHLGEGFWNQHPQWRQKNALLQDAKLDFLHLMDLQNPDCLKAALDDLSNLLAEDWDGVDIAEFTITGAGGEALEGPSRPDYFVSFGAPARAEFSMIAGFDPLELENPTSPHFWKRDSAGLETFYQYRTTVNKRLLRKVVEYIVGLRDAGKREWELIHTIVDNSLHPEFDRLLGFDLKSTLELLNEHNIVLNVEDPFMEWTQPPDRYGRLTKTLTSLVPSRPSMIDINVVPVHPNTQEGFATAQATGTELLQQIQLATERQGRVCIYCESSVFPHDWLLIPFATAAGASIRMNGGEWIVSTPKTVVLSMISGSGLVHLDGAVWPCHADNGIILPSGRHRLAFNSNDVDSSTVRGIRLEAISDELVECTRTVSGIALIYESSARCLLSFTMRPAKMLLDGSPANLVILKGEDRFVVLAPSGRHRLSVAER